MNKFLAIISLAMLAELIALAVPAYAAIPQPDNPPTVTAIHVNRNLYTSGDSLFYGEYFIPYGTLPGTTVDQNFEFRLYDSSNTLLGVTNPYPKYNKGYNHGLIAFYIPSGIAWGDASYFQIFEESTVSSPVTFNFTVATSNYSIETTQISNQAEATKKLSDIGISLAAEYNATFFSNDQFDNPKLTSDGETYYRGAIPGLRAEVPQLFIFQQSSIDMTSANYTTRQFDLYEQRNQGSWVGDGMQALGDQMGISGNTFMTFVSIIIALAIIVFSFLMWRHGEPGYMVASLWLICSMLMGWMSTPIFAIIFQCLAIFIGYVLFYSKSVFELTDKNISFFTFCYFSSVLICLMVEGSYFGTRETSIFAGMSIITTYPIPIIGSVPIMNPTLLTTLGKIITWQYSFYSGGYAIFSIFWMFLLTPGLVFGLAKLFVPILTSIIGLFRPNISIAG